MLDWSIDQSQHPVAIRVPVGPLESGRVDQTDYSQLNKNQLIQAGSKVAFTWCRKCSWPGKKQLP